MTNWPVYEAGLRRRGDLTCWLDEAALAGWNAPRRTKRGGQPLYTDRAVELVLTLRLVFHLALRQAEGFAHSVLRLLGLDLSVPDHTTLSLRGRTFAGRQPRAVKHDRPVNVVLDSTGQQVFGQGEWNAEKHGRIPRQWRKLHLAVDAESGEVLAHVLTDTDVGDITAVPVLLSTVEGPIASVIADGAYDGASVYQTAPSRRHDPSPDIVIPPRATSIAATKDDVTHVGVLTARDRHIRDIAQKDRLAWQKKIR
ncbi:MAG: IS5 family transposase [Janthinobacterium lividum]